MGIFQQSFGFNGAGGIGPGYNAFQASNYVNPNQNSLFNPSFPTPESREQFQQQRQTNPYASNPNDPSIMGSAMGMIASPIGQTSSESADPFQSRNAYIRGVTTRPTDHAMNFAQQWGVPFAAMMAANRFSRIRVNRTNERAGRVAAGFSRLGSSLTGKSTDETARLAERASRTQGVFEAAGNSLGRGATRGFFGAARRVGLGGMFGESGTAAAFESGAADTIGAATGVAGGLALPFAAAEVGVGAANRAFFKPYTDIRRGSMAMRHDFQNRYFGRHRGGDVLTGYGLSRSQAVRTAGQVEQSGIHDLGLSGKQYQEISDYSARSGLLDNVSSSSQISSKVKQIADEVKVVMEVGNMKSVKDAVKSISKLRNMGASSTGGAASQISNMARGISSAAGAAGTSMSQVFQASEQASQQYRQAGLAPAEGMLASANTYAGFKAAYRVGAISPEMRAIMGGASGATDTMAGITSAALSSPEARIRAYDRSRNHPDNTPGSMFTGPYMQGMARHPYETQGKYLQSTHKTLGQDIKNGDLQAIMNATSYERSVLASSVGHNGKISENQFMALLHNKFHLSNNQVQSVGEMFKTQGSSAVYQEQRNASEARYQSNRYRQHAFNMNVFGNGWFGKSVMGARRAAIGAISVGASAAGDVASVPGEIGDAFESLLPGFDNTPVTNVVGNEKHVRDAASTLLSGGDSDQAIRNAAKKHKEALKTLVGATGVNPDLTTKKGVETLRRNAHVIDKNMKNYTIPLEAREVATYKSGAAPHRKAATHDLQRAVSAYYKPAERGHIEKDARDLMGKLNDIVNNPSNYSSEEVETARSIFNSKNAKELTDNLTMFPGMKGVKKGSDLENEAGTRHMGEILYRMKEDTHQSQAIKNVRYVDKDSVEKASKNIDKYLTTQGYTLHGGDKGAVGVRRLGMAQAVVEANQKEGRRDFWKNNSTVQEFARELGIDTTTSKGKRNLISAARHLAFHGEKLGVQNLGGIALNKKGKLDMSLDQALDYGTDTDDTKRFTVRAAARNAAGIKFFNPDKSSAYTASGVDSDVAGQISHVNSAMTALANHKTAKNLDDQNTKAKKSTSHTSSDTNALTKDLADSFDKSSRTIESGSNTLESAANTMHRAVKTFNDGVSTYFSSNLLMGNGLHQSKVNANN